MEAIDIGVCLELGFTTQSYPDTGIMYGRAACEKCRSQFRRWSNESVRLGAPQI